MWVWNTSWYFLDEKEVCIDKGCEWICDQKTLNDHHQPDTYYDYEQDTGDTYVDGDETDYSRNDPDSYQDYYWRLRD